MMDIKEARSLRRVLIAIVMVANGFVVTLLVYTIYEARQQQEREIGTALENVALLLDQNLGASTSRVDLVLRSIVDKLEGELRTSGRLDELQINSFLKIRQTWLSNFAVFRVTDASGIAKYGAEIVPGAHTSYADRDFFTAHRGRDDRGLIVSNLLMGHRSHKWMIAFARRYNNPDGSFAGVVSASVPVSNFEQLLSGLNLGPHDIALLRDADGGLIARYPGVSSTSQRVGTKIYSRELADIIRSGIPAKTYFSNRTGDGVSRKNTYRRLSAMPFHLVVGTAADDYLADWRSTVITAAITETTFFAFTFFLGWLLWRSSKLVENASERSRLLLQRASDGIYIYDSFGNVIEASDSFCSMLGYRREELLGMNVIQWEDAMIPPHEIRQAVSKQIERGEISMLETRHRRKDGSLFDVEVSSYPLELQGKWVVFCSSRDITERKKIERALIAAHEKTNDLAKRRAVFLANMSHEIRTPMTGIMGLVELVLDTELNSNQREYLELVYSSAQKLLSVSNDVLDISKIEAGKLEIESVPIDLRQILNDTLRTLEPKATKKKLELNLRYADDIPVSLYGDPIRLSQIFVNLIDNAIKFTIKGNINVDVIIEKTSEEGTWLQFAVCDTGIGIPVERMTSIFEAFAQVNSSITREYGGTGLGLAICSKLVNLMGGRIWLESQIDIGSTFYLTLPFICHASDEPPTQIPVPGEPSSQINETLQILLVEDIPAIQKFALNVLSKAGYQVLTASNGKEALELTKANRFDAILMDLLMPVMDGLSATRLIRAHGVTTPIIALTAHVLKEIYEECMAAGIDEVLPKPVTGPELLIRLAKVIGQKQRAR